MLELRRPRGRRVVVTQYVYPDALRRLTDAGLEVVARDDDRPASHEELVAMASSADALVCLLTDHVDEEVLRASAELAVVANVAAGFNNIDVAAATRAGVAVTNAPGVLTEATADLTFALLLAAARRIPEGDAAVRAGDLAPWKLEQEPLGIDVHGQTLGLLGFGQIGRAVARRAQGFGMRVLCSTRSRMSAEDERAAGVEHVDVDTLLRESDFLSVHVPLTEQTRAAIDADALRRMKTTAVLVNTARGPVVDEAALADALARGIIAGAGLDVFENEPAVHPGLLALRERVVLLPHLGSATRSTRTAMVDLAVDNVLAAMAGERPPNLVNGNT